MRLPAPRLPLIAAALLLAASCNDTPPVSSCSDCGPNQLCEDGACACQDGFLDCDGAAANGCEVQGDKCGACVSESDAEFCLRLGRDCDFLSDLDNCGQPNTADCGVCSYPLICGAGGTPNVCGQCLVETDQQFCQRHGKNCGLLSGMSNCGQPNTADCGQCALPETCGGGGTLNVCGSGCAAESPAETCLRAGKNCGTLTVPNNCGVSTTVDCGPCTSPQSCGGGGVANVCGEGCVPETAAGTCARLGFDCGLVATTDNCGVPVSVNCGQCTAPATCAGAGAPNVCGTGCQAETDAQLCARLGRECGPLTAANNCGVTVSVDCGACPIGESCSLQGRCACATGTTCAAQGVACGPASDGCGGTLDCGGCGTGEACAQGQCQPVATGCTSDSQCASGNCTNSSCEPRAVCVGDPSADVNLECAGDAECSGYLTCAGYVFIVNGRCFEPCNPVGDGVGSCCLPGHHCGTLLINLYNQNVCCDPNATYDTGLGIPLYCNPGELPYKCNTDGDCPGSAWALKRCDNAAGGLGNCVDCLGDSDCLHVCVNKACVRCRSSSDCSAEAPFCVDNQCLECRSAADCAAPTPYCQASTSTCIECEANADCGGAEPYCETYYGNCQQCLEHAHCPATKPKCRASGVCAECISASDCAAGERCENYVCVI